MASLERNQTRYSPASRSACGFDTLNAPAAGRPRLPARPAAISFPRWCRCERLRRRALGRRCCGLSRGERHAKRMLDLLLCLLLGLPAAILVGLAACAVRWDSPGAALFAQWRVGAHGRRFRLWKLRTMVANAGALKGQLTHLNELPWPDFKITNDPRITGVGRWLRRSSLDELPQLWNVWRGEMSFVGPRPSSFGLEHYRLWHTERLALPPGITGLWQITARARCDFDQRLRLDLAYLRSWRLRLDLAILVATLAVVCRGKGAR